MLPLGSVTLIEYPKPAAAFVALSKFVSLIETNGVRKCGDVTRHPGCEPLTEDDKTEIRETTRAALERADEGLRAAPEGLADAQRALHGNDSDD